MMKKLLYIILFFPLSGFTQTFTLGWVGNVKEAPLGFYFTIPDKRQNFDWYIDAKMNTGGEVKGQDYNNIMSIGSSSGFGDKYIGEKQGDVLIVDFGASFFLHDYYGVEIRGYSAIGISWEYYHRQYFDESRILSSNGYYYHSEDSKIAPNLAFGTIFNTDKVSFIFGFDLAPKSLNIGLGIPFP